jgi:hypothetical protein
MTAQETNLLNAFETTLTGTIGASDLTFTVNSVVDSASNTLTAPCYLVLNPDSATNREVVLVTSINVGTKTLTLDNINKRYLTGSAATSGLSHASGSVVRMSPLQQHIEDLNDRVDELPTNSSTDTLTNKTIDADNNTISNLEVDNLKSGVLDTDLSSTAGTDTTLPSAKAVKTYVDAQITAEDLDFQADTGGALSIDLDSETLTFTGGTGINTSGSGNAVTFEIDSTVVTESSTDTLTNKTINLENNTAIVEFAVTVANPGSGNRYYLDGEVSANIQLVPGVTYRFDQSDGSNSGHPLRLSTTKNGTHASGSAYTTGVTVAGSAGSTGGYTQIVVNAATADNLYYYCTSHSQMGGDSVISINTSGNVAGSGISLSANTFAIDIPNLSNEGTADNDDLIIIYDDTASGLKKQTRAAFLTGTGVGNMNSFTISDGATSQTISDGNTVTFSGTSNEVEVAVSATDTVTIGLPSTITVGLSATSTLADGVTATTQSAGDNSTKVATTAYVDAVSVDDNLTVSDGSSSTTVDLDTQSLTIAGTANEIETTATAQTLTISLPATINANTTGNAATATALETARTIAGKSFDGTGNITIEAGDLSNVSTSGVSDGQVLVYNNSASEFQPGSVGSATALIDGDSDFTLSDGIANGIHYELDNTDMANWNQAGVVLSTAGGIFQHHQTQAATYSVPASTGAVLAGPITITGTITNNGTMVVI